MSISTNRSMPRESALCTAHAQAKASCLQLPQLRLQGPLACFQDACLLVVGGRAPEAAWLREAAKGREVWAVDHGLDACLAAGIRPQRLIGDGDSAAPAASRRTRKARTRGSGGSDAYGDSCRLARTTSEKRASSRRSRSSAARCALVMELTFSRGSMPLFSITTGISFFGSSSPSARRR